MAKLPATEPPGLAWFKPESFRGGAGFFRVGQTRRGQWWLLDPSGRSFFLKAVAAVNQHGRAGPPPSHRGAYAQAADRLYGSDEPSGFARAALTRLRAWNVNTLGPWAEPVLAGGSLYATELVNFIQAGVPVIHDHGVRLPDVFDPGWTPACNVRAAEVVARWTGRPELVGYYTDDALGWGEPRAERPALLQICLSLEPAFAAYHAAWEFVLAPHGGDLAALARAWSLDLANKEMLRQRTLSDRVLTTAGFLRDHERFAREFARRYFVTTAAALRAHDPQHLILGCRFAEPPGATVLAESVYPHVDVLSWQCHAPDFAVQAELYAKTAGMPSLLVAAGILNDRFRTAPFKTQSGPTRLERMLRDNRQALTAACVHPAVVGYEWARWADEPDEEPPFGAGLVHVDDRETIAHTELVAQINARAERIRWRAGEAGDGKRG